MGRVGCGKRRPDRPDAAEPCTRACVRAGGSKIDAGPIPHTSGRRLIADVLVRNAPGNDFEERFPPSHTDRPVPRRR